MILYCKQWDKVVSFYRDLLQLPVNFSTDWFVEFNLTPDSRLSIADENRSSTKSCAGKGITIALEVKDIDAMRESITKKGLDPTGIKKHLWAARVFYLFDPEGHRIEIWQPYNHNKDF
jgi:predicted enzyme related to lactoylglutathione lyase